MGLYESESSRTVHERTVAGALRRLRIAGDTPEVVVRAIEDALVNVDRGHVMGRYDNAVDADSHLWVIRLGLLEQLSRMAAPEVLPLGYLLSLGDGTPSGWTVALSQGIAIATGPERPREYPQAAGRFARSASVHEALERCRQNGLVDAKTPGVIEFPTSSVRTILAPLSSRESEPNWQCQIQFLGRLGTEVAWPELDADRWEALRAVAAGLFAIDRLALPADRAARGREHLMGALLDLLCAGCGVSVDASSRELVEQVVDRLDAERPDRRTSEPAPSERWTWPSAHALVVGALDRYAGSGGEPVTNATPPGTCVTRLDPALSRTIAWGTILAADEQPDPTRSRRRHRRDSVPTIPVRIAGSVVRCRPAELRTASRARLFH